MPKLPLWMKNLPRMTQTQRLGVQTQPLGRQTQPLGRRTQPLRRRTQPLGACPEPLRLRPFSSKMGHFRLKPRFQPPAAAGLPRIWGWPRRGRCRKPEMNGRQGGQSSRRRRASNHCGECWANGATSPGSPSRRVRLAWGHGTNNAGPGIIFDRNSQIRFHKPMLTKATGKSTVHALVHALWPNTC